MLAHGVPVWYFCTDVGALSASLLFFIKDVGALSAGLLCVHIYILPSSLYLITDAGALVRLYICITDVHLTDS